MAINYTSNNSTGVEYRWRLTDGVAKEEAEFFECEAKQERKSAEYIDSWQLSQFCFPVIIVTPAPPTCQIINDSAIFEEDAYRVPDFSRKIKIVNIFQTHGAVTKTDDIAPVDYLKREAEREQVPDYSQKVIKIVNNLKADGAVTKTEEKRKKKTGVLTRIANLFRMCIGRRKTRD